MDLNSIDFRSLLQEEFLKRKTCNSQYSLRSFAKGLEISPSFLSLVFNKKRKISEDIAVKISENMNWKLDKKNLFLDLVRYENTKDRSFKAKLKDSLKLQKKKVFHYQKLNQEKFKFISEWHHLALLELLELENCQHDSKWLADKLSIDKTSIELALTRLIRLNLVKFENDRYVKLLDNQVEDVPSLAIREFHKNMIKKAYLSITQQKYNERDITGTVISINSDKLPEAKEKIKKFRQEMNELLEQGNKRDRLYQLNVQLFRLDKDL